jgi:acetylornithine/succinyldiaminopimelate/putrescine aminotransferase
VYGKNLCGGIAPLCGITARDDIMGDNTEFMSGSTFAGTPAGCAAAIRTLQIFERDKIVDHAHRLGVIAAEIMGGWQRHSIVRQARGNGLLLGVSFGKPDSAEPEAKDWWISRAVRGKMLENGVWAISDRQDTIRMYPALNMDEAVLREGLQIMEDAIRHVEQHGHIEGDAAAWPSGVAGF